MTSCLWNFCVMIACNVCYKQITAQMYPLRFNLKNTMWPVAHTGLVFIPTDVSPVYPPFLVTDDCRIHTYIHHIFFISNCTQVQQLTEGLTVSLRNAPMSTQLM